MKLRPEYVEKPWGRTGLGGAAADAQPIGEIWFAAPDGRPLPLLVKHIFTEDWLSVQVHPGDDEARARGLAGGKSECWYVTAAEPGAMVALGFREKMSAKQIRAAALDGSVARLLDWIEVRSGDFFYVPAGTVHAIGPGISLIEVQQPSDVTYRLYDYGRPRPLHLDDALAVASRTAYSRDLMSRASPGKGKLLLDGPHFCVLLLAGARARDPLSGRDRFAIPLQGCAEAAGETAGPGESLFVPAAELIGRSDDALLLVAAAGPYRRAGSGTSRRARTGPAASAASPRPGALI